MEKQILPLLALRGKMVYPNTSVYFEVSRPKSMAALEQAVNHEQRIFLVNQIDPSLDKPEEEDLYTVGTVAKILQMVKAGQGVLRVFVEGEARARITSYIEFDGCVKVEVEEIPDTNYPENPVEEEAFFRMLEEEAQEFSEKNPGFFAPQLQKAIDEKELLLLINELASQLPFELGKKQQILEESDVKKQAEMLLAILKEEVEISIIRNELAEKAHELGLEVLLEIHSSEELIYIDKKIDMVGINNRNLGTFFTDVENSFRLAGQLPQDAVLVSESGISDPEIVNRLRAAGFRGFLIGETFMKTQQPGETLQNFLQAIQ